MTTWQQIHDHIETETLSESLVVHRIDGAAVGDSWRELIVIYNSGVSLEVALPEGQWKIAMEKSDPSQGGGRIVSRSVLAEGTAVTILYRD